VKCECFLFEVWSRECFIEVYINNQCKIVIIYIIHYGKFIHLSKIAYFAVQCHSDLILVREAALATNTEHWNSLNIWVNM
jgi:hypothetical protein